MPFPFTEDKDIASLFGDGWWKQGFDVQFPEVYVSVACVCVLEEQRQLNIYYTVNQYVLSFQAK